MSGARLSCGLASRGEGTDAKGYHIDRGSPYPGRTPGAAHVLRLCRFRLVYRGHLPGQRVGLSGHQAAPAGRSGHDEPLARQHDDRPAGRNAGGPRTDGADRDAARRWRDPCCPCRRSRRRALYALDHEHLLHRGRCRAYHRPVLVPALRHAGPRLHRPADRPREGRRLLRPGADAGLADPRTTPQGHPQRPQHAAEDDAGQPRQLGHQAALVLGHAAHQAPLVRQHPRPRRGGGRHEFALLLDRDPSSIQNSAGTTSSVSRTGGAAS